MWFLSNMYSPSVEAPPGPGPGFDQGDLSKDTTAPQRVPAGTSASPASRSSSGRRDPSSATCRLCHEDMSEFFPPPPQQLRGDHSYKPSIQPPSICFVFSPGPGVLSVFPGPPAALRACYSVGAAEPRNQKWAAQQSALEQAPRSCCCHTSRSLLGLFVTDLPWAPSSTSSVITPAS